MAYYEAQDRKEEGQRLVWERDVQETWEMEERRRELVGRLTAEVVGSDAQGVKRGEMVEERVEEAEVNDGVVRSKTRTITSVEVSFTFNNNLVPSEKEAQIEEVADIMAWEEDDIILLEEEEEQGAAGGASSIRHLPAPGVQVEIPRFTDMRPRQQAVLTSLVPITKWSL